MRVSLPSDERGWTGRVHTSLVSRSLSRMQPAAALPRVRPSMASVDSVRRLFAADVVELAVVSRRSPASLARLAVSCPLSGFNRPSVGNHSRIQSAISPSPVSSYKFCATAVSGALPSRLTLPVSQSPPGRARRDGPWVVWSRRLSVVASRYSRCEFEYMSSRLLSRFDVCPCLPYDSPTVHCHSRDAHATLSWTVFSAAMHSSFHCAVRSLCEHAPTARTGDAAVSDCIHSSTSARTNCSTLIDATPELSSDSERRVRADAASWSEMRKWVTKIPMILYIGVRRSRDGSEGIGGGVGDVLTVRRNMPVPAGTIRAARATRCTAVNVAFGRRWETEAHVRKPPRTGDRMCA